MKGFVPLPLLIFLAVVAGTLMIKFLPHKQPKIESALQSGAVNTPAPTASSQKPSVASPTAVPKPKITPTLTPTPTPTPTSVPNSTIKPAINSADITLNSPAGSGQIHLELYGNEPYMDSQSVYIASFRYTGTVSNLKPNANYAVMFCPTTGGGCSSSTTFTTNSNGNASFKEPKDSSYSGIGINYSTNDPIRSVKIGNTSQNPYGVELGGDFNFFR